MARQFHVAPGGNDDGPGDAAAPFATLARAQAAVRAAGAAGATVWLRAGTHRLAQPLRLGPQDSGTTYAAWPDEPVTLSGGPALQGRLRPFRDGILICRPEGLPPGARPTQLFADGRRQIRARYPDAGDLAMLGADAWPHHEVRLPPRPGQTWARPAEAVLHAVTSQRWGSVHWRLAGGDPATGRLELGAGGWQMGTAYQRADGAGVGPGARCFVENVLEELDAPGEWYWDRADAALYFLPPQGLDPAGTLLETDGLACLVDIRGSAAEPVRGVQLVGLRLAHTAPTYLEPYEEPSLGDWAIHRGGAVRLEGAEDCAVRDCLFDALGGNGVFVSGYARRVAITGNAFRQLGDSAVCLAGRSHLRRDRGHRCPQCGAEHAWDWDEPGEDVPADCVVSGNAIEEIGVFGKQTAGVFLSLTRRTRIAHNRIRRVPRAAICINDGVFGGHVVEWNDIADTVRETGDHGPLNAWGRDRAWCQAQSHGPASHPAGDVRRDARETTVIRYNRFRDRHGWGIDLDDGASNYHVHSNLCLGVSVKLREGDLRLVENNLFIAPANPPGLHVGCEGNADRFEGNIVVTPAPQPAYQVIHPPRQGAIAALDRNLFWDGAGGFRASLQPREGGQDLLPWPQWQAAGYDRHSVLADPLFVDAAAGDYRLQPGSPALALGFRPWDLDAAGLPPGPRRWEL